jgi:hypothetical protein
MGIPMPGKTLTTPVLLRPGISACPFCGGAGVKGIELYRTVHGKAQKAYSVVCDNDNCNAAVPGDTFDEAKEHWNARI